MRHTCHSSKWQLLLTTALFNAASSFTVCQVPENKSINFQIKFPKKSNDTLAMFAIRVQWTLVMEPDPKHVSQFGLPSSLAC